MALGRPDLDTVQYARYTFRTEGSDKAALFFSWGKPQHWDLERRWETVLCLCWWSWTLSQHSSWRSIRRWYSCWHAKRGQCGRRRPVWLRRRPCSQVYAAGSWLWTWQLLPSANEELIALAGAVVSGHGWSSSRRILRSRWPALSCFRPSVTLLWQVQRNRISMLEWRWGCMILARLRRCCSSWCSQHPGIKVCCWQSSESAIVFRGWVCAPDSICTSMAATACAPTWTREDWEGSCHHMLVRCK